MTLLDKTWLLRSIKVILGAASAARASMVAKALTMGCCSGMPTGYVEAEETAWFCDVAAAADFAALEEEENALGDDDDEEDAEEVDQ